MIRGVRLDRLPESVQFPPELKAKISYSQEKRELRFDGFMSKTDFDKLVRLHNDLSYQRALEQLFQTCTFSAASGRPAQHGPQPLILTGLAAAAFLITMFLAAVVWWW